jgi:hypothetical protein
VIGGKSELKTKKIYKNLFDIEKDIIFASLKIADKPITHKKQTFMNNLLNEDAEEAPVSLNGMLAGFDENTSAYAHMPTKNPYSHFCFAMNIKMTEEEVMPALKNYLTELERGECREVLCIEKKMLQKEYWQKGGLLRRNLQAMRERLESKRIIAAILETLGTGD